LLLLPPAQGGCGLAAVCTAASPLQQMMRAV